MTDFLQLTIAGLSQGSVYSLLAIGLIATYSVRHVFNIAQGDFAMLAGFMSVTLISAGMPILPALIIAIVAVTLISVLLERFTIARVKNLSTLISIILTIGISITLQAIMLFTWGPQAVAVPMFPGETVQLAGLSIRSQEIWMLGTLLVVFIAVTFFYEKTIWGKALNATATQPVAARIVGISPAQASMIAFAIAGFVGAVAGVVSSPIQLTVWSGGLLPTLKAFVAAILGGMSSIKAAVAGGLLLGLLEMYVSAYISTGWRDAAAFIILIAVLVIRPSGLVIKTKTARV